MDLDHRGDAGRIELSADRDLCQTSGMCERLCPDVFTLGDDGIVIIRNPHPDPSSMAAVMNAISSCPTGALTITRP